MNIKLSIIVPFYNTGKYIVECLDSIYLQDIEETQYEVICINDCSTDETKNFVLNYKKKHKNLILVEHSQNKMLGAARNSGLSFAKGKYIWFIDSDDYIKSNVLSTILSETESNNLEILHFNCEKFTETAEYYKYKFYLPPNHVSTGIEFLNDFFKFNSMPFESCFKVFKKSFLVEHNLFYPEGVFFEDAVHSLKALLLVQRFKYIPDVIYYYRVNPNSIIGQNLYSPIKLADWVNFSSNSLNLLNTQKKNTLFNKLENIFIHYICDTQTKVMHLTKQEKAIFYDRLDRFNKKNTYLSFYILHPGITLKGIFKELLISAKINYPFLWKVAKKIKRSLQNISKKGN